MNPEKAKKTAAEKALGLVEDDMILGLGTGSTVKYFLQKLAQEIKEGNLNITGIPSSENTKKISQELGIPLSTLDEYSQLDLCIDGADQVDENFNLIKGGGGAHTREKIVASAAKKFAVIVDERKLSEKLSVKVPVEILKFSRGFAEEKLRKLGGVPQLRKNFSTDQGNVILDTDFGEIKNPLKLELKINEIPGVIENGIFARRKPEKVLVGYGKRENK